MIFFDGEQVFPDRANNFKTFLKKYLIEQDGEYLLEALLHKAVLKVCFSNIISE